MPVAEQDLEYPDAGQTITQPLAGRKPAAGSIRDRIQRRRQEVEERTTELFPVPNYADFIAVELKVVSWAVTETSIEAGARKQGPKMLNVACDELVAATIGFYEIKDEDATVFEELTDDQAGGIEVTTWTQLGESMAGLSLPDTARRREQLALIGLCRDQGAMALSNMYRLWLGGSGGGLRAANAEVEQGFRPAASGA